jgi:hypothetical protein
VEPPFFQRNARANAETEDRESGSDVLTWRQPVLRAMAGLALPLILRAQRSFRSMILGLTLLMKQKLFADYALERSSIGESMVAEFGANAHESADFQMPFHLWRASISLCALFKLS